MRRLPVIVPLMILVLVFSTAALIGSETSAADAPSIEDEQPITRWARQQEEQAVLLLHEGTEHVLIALTTYTGDLSIVFWLFPVAAAPEDVAIELVDQFPLFGYDRISSTALHHRRPLHNLVYPCTVQCGLVINPLVGACCFLAPALSSEDTATSIPRGRYSKAYGLHTEALAAGSTDALAAQLAERGVELTDEELAAYEPYCRPGFALILTRVLDAKAVRAKFTSIDYSWQRDVEHALRPALYIRFPAKQLWFPARPRAADRYEGRRPDIVVLGHVRPTTDGNTLRSARYGLVRQGDFEPAKLPAQMQAALDPGKTSSHTRLSWPWTHSQQDFTGDITFEPIDAAPAHYELVVTSLLQSIPFFFVSFAVLLYVTGGLCGLIYLRQWRTPALLGLLGCLSFLAVKHYTCRHVAKRGRPLRPLVAWAYAFTYLVIFILLDAGITALLLVPLRY